MNDYSHKPKSNRIIFQKIHSRFTYYFKTFFSLILFTTSPFYWVLTTLADTTAGSTIDVYTHYPGYSDGTDNNNNASDDSNDDGVQLGSASLQGQTLTAGNTVNLDITTVGSGVLNAWIDWNGDGDFTDAGEQIATDADVSGGTLNLTVPAGATEGNTYARFRYSSDTGLEPTGNASNGEVEDYQIQIIPGYEISPSAGNIIINEVLYNETGNSAATNDEFIEIFNASTSPVDISGWQLMDGNILANDTDNTGSITGNSSPYLFPNGTILQPGEYAVIWIGDNTPDHQATTATFQNWLEKSPKINNSGEDVWLYDKDGKIVDYIAYGSGTAINTPLPTSLNQWDDTHQTALAGASDGESISLAKNGVDSNTSTCWEHTTSGNANTQGCKNFLATKDTDDIGSRINSAGQNNNGTPLVILIKRVTALNNQPYTNIIDGVDTGNSTSTNYVPAPKDADDNHPNWLSNFLQGEINNIKVKPDDEIEYTIYFLSTGSTAAKNVLVCDHIPENTTFIPNIFNNETPNSDGLSGSDRGILWNYNGNTEALTNIQDGDAAQYFTPGIDPTTVYPAANCSGVNDNGAIVINLGNLPDATAPGTPLNSYGFVRFRGKVK
ncbi:MAG: lamin tail domain-containing protein [Cyanobacteria bacterium J06633_8]